MISVVVTGMLAARSTASLAAPGATCHILDESALAVTGHISPLFAADRDARDVGGARRVDGLEREGYVAFTFDDGPKHTTTPAVIRALLQYDVPATFFVVGHRLRGTSVNTEKNRATLREAIDAGFLIGNHTVNHRALADLRLERAADEIEENARIVGDILGYPPELFRPPYGSNNARVRRVLAARAVTEVLWSIDSKDYLPTDRKSLRKRVVADVVRRRGGVVLMHDTKAATAHTIAEILDDLEAENCRRLASSTPLILPVSLHYFLHEADGTARPIPAAIAARTEAYRGALPERCAART